MNDWKDIVLQSVANDFDRFLKHLDGFLQRTRFDIHQKIGLTPFAGRFNVRIDKYTLAFSGRVDLNTREVDLRTEIPLAAVGGTFRELDGLADDLVVPLVTRGTLDRYRTEIEPDFLAEAAVQVGIRRGLDELEKETGVPIGDIFEGLFGKGRKKKK